MKFRRTALSLALVAGSLFTGIVAAELGLRALTNLGVIEDVRASFSPKVDDPILEYRLEPNSLPGIDSRGYRNPKEIQKSCAVALGDSFTYGYGARLKNTWPAQFEKLSGLSTYNMGVGAMGPAQYMVLTEKAHELSPDILIYAIYLGNDLTNAVDIFTLEHWREYGQKNKLGLEDFETTLRTLASFKTSFLNRPSLRDKTRNFILPMLLKKLPAVSNFVSYRRDIKSVESGGASLLKNERAHTIVPHMFLAQEINERGIRYTNHFFSKIKSLNKGKKTLVAFIPSKARTLMPEIEQTELAERPQILKELAFNDWAITELSQSFREMGLETIDTTPSLWSAVKEGRPLYPKHAEIHPNKEGYRAIAQAIDTKLKDLNWSCSES